MDDPWAGAPKKGVCVGELAKVTVPEGIRTDRDGQGCLWSLEAGTEAEVRVCRERQG